MEKKELEKPPSKLRSPAQCSATKDPDLPSRHGLYQGGRSREGGRDFLKNIQAISNTLNECVEPFAIIKAYFGKVVIIHGILREDKITFCKYWRGLVPCKPP